MFSVGCQNINSLLNCHEATLTIIFNIKRWQQWPLKLLQMLPEKNAAKGPSQTNGPTQRTFSVFFNCFWERFYTFRGLVLGYGYFKSINTHIPRGRPACSISIGLFRWQKNKRLPQPVHKPCTIIKHVLSEMLGLGFVFVLASQRHFMLCKHFMHPGMNGLEMFPVAL